MPPTFNVPARWSVPICGTPRRALTPTAYPALAKCLLRSARTASAARPTIGPGPSALGKPCGKDPCGGSEVRMEGYGGWGGEAQASNRRLPQVITLSCEQDPRDGPIGIESS